MTLPDPIKNLINNFSRLPGIGPKTASRLTFYLLRAPDDLAKELAESLLEIRSGTALCETCFNITASGRTECEICANPERDKSTICVVEEPLDVLALERTGSFPGCYHVLHGALSPIEGIGPEDLRMKELFNRVRAGRIAEIILATNPSMEGDYTAAYVHQQLGEGEARITRLARGLPIGGDLEYADQSTLQRALDGRQGMG